MTDFSYGLTRNAGFLLGLIVLSDLKMEAVLSSETSIKLYRTARRYITSYEYIYISEKVVSEISYRNIQPAT
jgi:hypothetical protein